MGWNDRLPEDPHIPYESAQDRDDYDAWAEYVELCRVDAAAGLTSQNIDPATLKSAATNNPEQPNRSPIAPDIQKLIGTDQ